MTKWKPQIHSLFFTIIFVGQCQWTCQQDAIHTVSEERGGEYHTLASVLSLLFTISPNNWSFLLEAVLVFLHHYNCWSCVFPVFFFGQSSVFKTMISFIMNAFNGRNEISIVFKLFWTLFLSLSPIRYKWPYSEVCLIEFIIC